MALPSSGPIGVGAIYQELTGSAVEGPTQVLKCFNGTYATINPGSPSQPSSSTPYSLGSFHGYDQNASGGGSFQISDPVDEFDPNKACQIGPSFPPQTLYWNGSGIPFIGEIVFTDSGLTSPYNGQQFWYYVYGNNFSYQIRDDGLIMDASECK